MKKTGILHNQLSQVIATMGHTDMLVIGDAGLPVPKGVPCIDLAITVGLPRFMDVVTAVASELEVERMILADELTENESGENKSGENGGDLIGSLQSLFPSASLDTVPHERFKIVTGEAKAVVRTGETTPYANVILCSGVTF